MDATNAQDGPSRQRIIQYKMSVWRRLGKADVKQFMALFVNQLSNQRHFYHTRQRSASKQGQYLVSRGLPGQRAANADF